MKSDSAWGTTSGRPSPRPAPVILRRIAQDPRYAQLLDEILDEAVLPRCYTTLSTCFRREAGAAGKDTGYDLLALLPVLWVALYGSSRQVLTLVAGVAE